MVSLVSAFGVSSPYWNENPLELARGESKIVELNVQNMVGSNDVSVQAELVQGNDFASLGDNSFTVEAGTSDTIIPLTIKLPEETKPGESKLVRVEFRTVNEGSQGVAVGTGMVVAFNVIAKDEVKESNSTGIIISLALIALLAVIIIFILKRKKKY